MSPSFPFLLLGLCVCVRVCFRKSCFVLPAALAWFHCAFPSLSPSLPPLPSFGGTGAVVSWDVTSAPLSAHPTPRPRHPPASPWNVPPPPWNCIGDHISFVAASWREVSQLLSLPLQLGLLRVTSLGGRSSGPSLGFWAPGDSDLSSGRSSRLLGATWQPLVYCPSPSRASASPSGGLSLSRRARGRALRHQLHWWRQSQWRRGLWTSCCRRRLVL